MLAGEMSQQPEQSFLALAGAFGGKTRFITVAFLTHLLHPRVRDTGARLLGNVLPRRGTGVESNHVAHL